MAEGRRERMRNKIRSRGVTGMPPHEVVEFLLYPFIPRKDTSPLAKRLLTQFDGLEGLMQASENDLLAVEGMPQMAALTFPLYRDLLKLNDESQVKKSTKYVTNPTNAAVICTRALMHARNEKLVVFYLNSLGTVLAQETISEGNTTSTQFDSTLICRNAILHKASSVLLTHNHPTGRLKPSSDDLLSTAELEKKLKQINVKLIDHIIVCKEKFYSMKREGNIN
jgi:DNA repair protein RadC